MTLIGVFLSYRALQALKVAKWSFLTTSQWEPDSHHFGIAAILIGTVLIALVAIVVAVPLARGTALFISEYAPRRIKRTLVSLVDLMAAVPSVVYGLWGFFFLQPVLLVHGEQGNGLPRLLATYFGWIPLFHVTGADPRDPLQTADGLHVLDLRRRPGRLPDGGADRLLDHAGGLLARRRVGEREGALALGATRWGMIRSVVLPYGRGGMIGGTMLGLGRALGETIAVYLIISPVFTIQPHILQNGDQLGLRADRAALRRGLPVRHSALMAAGLALFLLTLVVNFGASSIVARSRSGAVSER